MGNRAGAEGARWRRLVSYVIARDYGVCHICGHAGATEADHLEPVTENSERALDASNLKAAHGMKPCPVCSQAAGKPVRCNQIRGAMSVARARRIIEERTGLKLGSGEKVRPSGLDNGRSWLPVSDQTCLDGPHEPALHSERKWYRPWKIRYYLSCVKCSMPMIPEPVDLVTNMLTRLLIEREKKGDGVSSYVEYPKDSHDG